MKVPFEKLWIPAAIMIGSLIVLLGVRFVAFKMLEKWAGKTETRFDDIMARFLKAPSIYWCVAMAIYTGIALSELPLKYANYAEKAIVVIMILSVTVAAANLSGKLLRGYVQASNLPISTTGLANAIVKGAILILGLLVMLSVLGISITPLITALGVGGLAVALALQDTLANLFAGIHILMEKSVRIGDFVKLESGQEGYVDDITWRTTRVKMLANNVVIIPNSSLAKSIVTNYYLPEKRMGLLVPVSVSYASDPEMIEKVLLDEVLGGVGSIPGLRGDPEPFVRFSPGFGASSLDFTIVCQVDEFVDQYFAQHELRKRIFRRFREEGIEIPYPHRTVYVREEREWNK